MSKTIIVFAPHPDDETLACGGTIAKRVSEGYEVFVVVLTDGRHAFSSVLGIYSNPTPYELREIRKDEVKKAMRILGVREENLFFLDFEDGTIEENEQEVEERVMGILSKKLPVEVYLPHEKDCHPDHRATNRIVRNAIRKSDLSTMSYKYTIMRRHAHIGPLTDALLNLFRRNIIRIDISRLLSLKTAAVNEFKSEISIISSRQERPVLKEIEKFLKSEETFVINR